jgi:hypothetical protein
VLLVDGEIAGTWRAKMVAGKRIDVTVSPFGTVPVRARADMQAEADVVAAARGAEEARLTVQ